MEKKQFIIQVLKRLEQPYSSVEDDIIIINPTSSFMLEVLPGRMLETDNSTLLIIDLKQEIDFVEYIAQLIKTINN